jgi:hypothetical protein
VIKKYEAIPYILALHCDNCGEMMHNTKSVSQSNNRLWQYSCRCGNVSDDAEDYPKLHYEAGKEVL